MNEVAVYKCSSWDEFIARVRTGRFIGPRLFRGHRDPTWKLSSRWERLLEPHKEGNPNSNIKETFAAGNHEQFREEFLERFKRHAWEVGFDLGPGAPGTDNRNEWWAVARHHGLITPLLDWSYSPYVAAYFAFTDVINEYGSRTAPGFIRQDVLDPEKFVQIWELSFIEKDLAVSGEFELITPRPTRALRQIMQRGCFTRLTHDVHIDIESYLRAKSKLNYLSRYDIPLQALPAAVTDMRLMGLSHVMLFQDLDGAAKEANAAPYIDMLAAQVPK